MSDNHTNASIPGNLKVSRKGDFVILTTRTATLTIPKDRALEVANALYEVSR